MKHGMGKAPIENIWNTASRSAWQPMDRQQQYAGYYGTDAADGIIHQTDYSDPTRMKMEHVLDIAFVPAPG
jgi:hypothetical protein